MRRTWPSHLRRRRLRREYLEGTPARKIIGKNALVAVYNFLAVYIRIIRRRQLNQLIE